MKKSTAERIVGFPLPLYKSGQNGIWIAEAQHPDFDYIITATSRREEDAIQAFVDENYRQISQQVCLEQRLLCLHCGLLKPLSIDHIIMRSHGRLDTRENLRALCSDCHKYRHEKAPRGWEPYHNLDSLAALL